MKKYNLIATASFGIESIVADELKELGYTDLKVDNGKVEFKGSAYDICKTNLWLRTADRVMLKVAEFEAHSFDELFELCEFEFSLLFCFSTTGSEICS